MHHSMKGYRHHLISHKISNRIDIHEVQEQFVDLGTARSTSILHQSACTHRSLHAHTHTHTHRHTHTTLRQPNLLTRTREGTTTHSFPAQKNTNTRTLQGVFSRRGGRTIPTLDFTAIGGAQGRRHTETHREIARQRHATHNRHLSERAAARGISRPISNLLSLLCHAHWDACAACGGGKYPLKYLMCKCVCVCVLEPCGVGM